MDPFTALTRLSQFLAVGGLKWLPCANPRLAVWKFASCDGCQLSLLDCEDELLSSSAPSKSPISRSYPRRRQRPLRYFSRRRLHHYPHDEERIHTIRRSSKLLITIGACATSGGIQALRNSRTSPISSDGVRQAGIH